MSTNRVLSTDMDLDDHPDRSHFLIKKISSLLLPTRRSEPQPSPDDNKNRFSSDKSQMQTPNIVVTHSDDAARPVLEIPSPRLTPWTSRDGGQQPVTSSLISPMELEPPTRPHPVAAATAPLPTPKTDKQGHPLRLTPAIIQRLPPWPIRTLPSFKPSSSSSVRSARPSTASSQTTIRPSNPNLSSSQSSSRRPAVGRLATMPTLAMTGSTRAQLHMPVEEQPDMDDDMDMDMDMMPDEDYFARVHTAGDELPAMDMDSDDESGGHPHRNSMDSIDEDSGSSTFHTPISPTPTPRHAPQSAPPTQTSFRVSAAPAIKVVTSNINSNGAGYFNYKPQKHASNLTLRTPKQGDYVHAHAAFNGNGKAKAVDRDDDATAQTPTAHTTDDAGSPMSDISESSIPLAQLAMRAKNWNQSAYVKGKSNPKEGECLPLCARVTDC
ncbi:hypothetical protein M422DRAFT_50858 [Sphaerobolus stellatus SS14]|uniref:Uncharacterized protein n=1 Tax=Sphaerobolus stellatus (strain SS14) TaxID=990650 RepID=A0A0C9T960_SPHS4|nr:hypothetical protein M422DRAFT_55886 [Sphaerobolus stellatus SS14]KIJ36702.1 hypothetical protein M422DRAFT_50858 [Sphaerobolus stellatus SS14]